MKSGVARWLMVAAILLVPAMALAQEATITGTVTDATGGVLPGVTVTAVHEATGNTFVGVTDERGIFRIPARVGGYRLTAELPGFTTVTRSGVNLLVGQTAAVDMQMTVTGVAGNRHRHRRGAAHQHHAVDDSAPTSTRGRCRSCRSRAATGRRSRCSRRATGRPRRAHADCRTAATCASSSSTWTASR